MVATADTLQRQLGERLFEGDAKPAWLLIDAMGVDVRDVVPETTSDEAIHLIPLDRKDIPTERYPYLVRMAEHDVELLRASVQWALEEQADPDEEQRSGFAIGGWLQADVEPKALARHLARCMNKQVPRVGRRYIRWADRRVLEWMWPVLPENERAALLGPIDHWWTLDRCGGLRDHPRVQPAAPQTVWRLEPVAWQHAQDCAPVQALIRGWLDFAELPPDYLPRVQQALCGARSLGLTSVDDLVLIGTYIVQVHPNLAAHPYLRAQVQQATAHNMLLSEALVAIPDPDGWDRMRDELNGAMAPTHETTRSTSHG